MATLTLSAQPRSEFGKNACRRLRIAGRIPAVVYGLKTDPVSLTVDNHELLMLLHHQGMSSIVDLEAPGLKTPCVIRDLLRHPVTDRFLHVDLLRIDLTVESNFMVEIVGKGSARGVREGGILETVTRALPIRCLPANLPHSIEVDLTDLGFGQSIHVGEIKMPEGVTLHCDASVVLFSVLAPKAVKEEVPAEEAEAVAEPEVVGKKKAEEEEAEAKEE